MYIDEIKLFAINGQKLETLIQAIRINSQDLVMKFSIKVCAMAIMKRENQLLMEGIELTNQEKIRTLQEKETYKHLTILEADSIK